MDFYQSAIHKKLFLETTNLSYVLVIMAVQIIKITQGLSKAMSQQRLKILFSSFLDRNYLLQNQSVLLSSIR